MVWEGAGPGERGLRRRGVTKASATGDGGGEHVRLERDSGWHWRVGCASSGSKEEEKDSVM